jgi:hypothetical protein
MPINPIAESKSSRGNIAIFQQQYSQFMKNEMLAANQLTQSIRGTYTAIEKYFIDLRRIGSSDKQTVPMITPSSIPEICQ